MSDALQWGGRFSASPDPALLRFGSSLEEDIVLAPFDVRCSQAHVTALERGGIISAGSAQALQNALQAVAGEIDAGGFAVYARASAAEDIHGAIDARVRELEPHTGELLHAGRSRNDQVATTLLLYCADRAAKGKHLAARIAAQFLRFANEEFEAQTLLAATTHWQPAQPVLLAFWLCAAAEPFVRDARRFAAAQRDALAHCPLGSAALAGSSLRLDRDAAASALGFDAPSRNAMDAIGNRDAALDLAHAAARSVMSASRVCEEFIIWCTPNFGYMRLGDEASTGSSLMPQKRNPDPFELVRAASGSLIGTLAGAMGSCSGIGLSYHRDLQVTKSAIIATVEKGLAALDAFARALAHVHFNRGRMTALAGEGFTVATDVADALIASGKTAREAHAIAGAAILAYEREGAPLDWPDARASVDGKATRGSTRPQAVRESIDALQDQVEELLA
ncbi:MAG TPA: argininosuccinate lyase [Candidatus Baltobacteraceae bacterium]|nr:argininosuccinate lyase [Candidatus Baltobacteraceae bacterium]